MLRLALATATAITALAVPAVAAAPTIAVHVSPNKAGAASSLSVKVADVGGATPRSLRIAAQPGFRVDLAAVAQRCTGPAGSCPAASRIGTGTAVVTLLSPPAANGQRTSTDYTADLTAFLAPPTTAGDRAGIVLYAREPVSTLSASVTGRLIRERSGGYTLAFANLPAPPSFAGYSANIRSIALTAGAKRGTHTLIRNPKTCPKGGYRARVRLDATVRSVRLACRR